PENPASRRSSSRSTKNWDIDGFNEASMAAEEARRYSLTLGLTSWDSVQETVGSRYSINSAILRSCAGLATDHSSDTAIASTSACAHWSRASNTLSSSSGRWTAPVLVIRSSTSNVRYRGT